MEEGAPQSGTPRRILVSGPTSASEQPALAASYLRCLELYQHLLLLLGTKSCRVVRLEQVNVGKIVEEYGRFRIWGEQTRATVPEMTRGSLDDTIRNDEGLKGAVGSILSQLSQHLSMGTATRFKMHKQRLPLIAIPIAEKKYDDFAQDSESSMSADSDQDSDSNLDFDLDEERNAHIPHPRRSRVSKISILLNHTFEQIRLLYHMSILLNRPGLSGRYLRSINKNEEDSKSSHFAEFDYEHVREKIQQWKGDLKIILGEDGKGETTTTAENIEERKNKESFASVETEILCQRLAKANTRRREQLQYWILHPDRPDVVQSQDAADDLGIGLAFNQGLAIAKSIATKSRTSTVKPGEQNTVTYSQAPKSTTSKQSFSTVAMTDLFDNQTKSRPRTTYAQSNMGNKTSNRVPDIPKVAKTSSTFKCPYCNLILKSKIMADRLSWKRHVFRDLRPYICTFPDCLNPQKLYLTRHDWIYHERQMHRRQWVCSGDCHQKFETKDLMMVHLRDFHLSNLTQHQIPIMIEMSERPIDEDEILACPLCPNKLFLNKLQIHLAEHLEAISLFVLPNEVEESENADSNDVVGTGLKPDEDETGTQVTLSSLGFSQNIEKDQTKEDFSKLLSVEEAKVEVKFETWGVEEAISAAIQVSSTADPKGNANTVERSGLESPLHGVHESDPVATRGHVSLTGVLTNLPTFLRQNPSDIQVKFHDLTWLERDRIREGMVDPSPDHRWARIQEPHTQWLDRYQNIHPWKHNRIRLRVPEGQNDYINASPITLQSVKTGKESKYITMQGPMGVSVSHVWRMIWDELASPGVIVMLNRTHEFGMEKCIPYFPTDPEAPPLIINENDEFCDGFKGSVKCVESDSYLQASSIEIRKLVMQVDGQEYEKVIWHLSYIDWPDFGVVPSEDLGNLFELIELSNQKNKDHQNPRVVHCSAGVGRSGTFIALEFLMAELEAGALEPEPGEDDTEYDPIFDVVNKLREQRRTMVQSETQYSFLYSVLQQLWAKEYPLTTQSVESTSDGERTAIVINTTEIETNYSD